MRRILLKSLNRRFFSSKLESNMKNNSEEVKMGMVDSIKSASEATTKDIHDLFQEMRRRRYNTRRFKIILGAFGTLTVFVFYEAITDFLSERATDVTHKSLEDPQFIADATVFGTTIGKQIVKNLSEDPEVETIFADFFTKLFTSDPIKGAASELSNDVVHSIVTNVDHEKIRDEATVLAKERIIQLFKDPEVQKQTSQFIWTTLGGAFYPFNSNSNTTTEKSEITNKD